MDISILLGLQQLRESLGSAVTGLFTGITFLGEPYVPLILTLLLFWCLDREAGLRIMLVSNVGDVINNLLKLCFCVYRPWIRSDRLHPAEAALSGATGYSFPSGHSSKAVSVYGELYRIYKKHGPALILLPILAVVIVFSRCFLGVHTPQDVLVGSLVGLLAILISDRALKWIRGAVGRDLIAGGIAVAYCAIVLAVTLLRSYPMDTDANGALLVDPIKMQHDTFLSVGAMLGMVIGLLLEKRYVRFTVDGSVVTRALRFVVGVITVLLIYFVLRKKVLQPLMGENWGSMLGALLGFVWGLYLYPLIFMKVRSLRK